MRAHTTIPLLGAVLLALPAPAAAQDPEAIRAAGRAPVAPPAGIDVLPLRPGTVLVRFHRNGTMGWDGAPSVTIVAVDSVDRGSQAERAGLAHSDKVVGVDGHPVPGWSQPQVELALAGPVGSVVEIKVERPGPADPTVRAVREEPAPAGLTGVLVTPHFVVHHRPGRERAARRVAKRAERGLARLPHLPVTGGRRGHLYLVTEDDRRPYPPMPTGPWGRSSMVRREERRPPLPAWAEWVSAGARELDVSGVLAYVAYGPPGRAADETDLAALSRAGAPSPEHHHAASLVAPVQRGSGDIPEPHAHDFTRTSVWLYVRERYGLRRFGELWRTQERAEVAVPRVLGIGVERLDADWKQYVLSVGPDRTAGPDATETALATGLVGALLLGCAGIARTREVG